jgi:adenosylhomocysteinase
MHAGQQFTDDRYGSLWELVSPADGALQSVGFAWVEVAPRATSPMHLHRATEELYHIVSGDGEMTVDGISQLVKPGDTIAIPIGAAHAIRAGDAGIGFVCVTSPPYDPEDDHEISSEGDGTC